MLEPGIHPRPFPPVLGSPHRPVSGGVPVSLSQGCLSPRWPRVGCSALGRRRGSCSLSLRESQFLLLRSTLCVGEGCARGPTPPSQPEPFYPRFRQNSAANTNPVSLSVLFLPRFRCCSDTRRVQGLSVSHHRSEPEFSVLRMLGSRAGKPPRTNLPAGHRHCSPPYEPRHAQVN